MEIAILVFFFAIFGGALFLFFLIWLLFRRRKSTRSLTTNYPVGSGILHGSGSLKFDYDDTDDEEFEFHTSDYFSEQKTENSEFSEITEQYQSVASAEAVNYSASDYGTNYDSDSGYDSNSGHDSGDSGSGYSND